MQRYSACLNSTPFPQIPWCVLINSYTRQITCRTRGKSRPFKYLFHIFSGLSHFVLELALSKRGTLWQIPLWKVSTNIIFINFKYTEKMIHFLECSMLRLSHANVRSWLIKFFICRQGVNCLVMMIYLSLLTNIGSTFMLAAFLDSLVNHSHKRRWGRYSNMLMLQ